MSSDDAKNSLLCLRQKSWEEKKENYETFRLLFEQVFTAV